LLGLLLQGLHKAGQIGFAISITGADDRRQVVVYRERDGIEDVLGRRSRAGENVKNGRFPGDGV
jgi:hypothetical protein